MICLQSDMNPDHAKHEAWLEEFQHKTRNLDAWLKEARSDIKAGDTVSLMESISNVGIEFSKLIDNKTLI